MRDFPSLFTIDYIINYTMAKTQTDPRSQLLELADNYGADFVLRELVVQMSSDDAKEFVDWMERNIDNF